MSIRATCALCGQKYELKEELAGTKFACKKCQQPVRIPNPSRMLGPVEAGKTVSTKSDESPDSDEIKLTDDAIPAKSRSFKEEEELYLQTAPIRKIKKKRNREGKNVDKTGRVGWSWAYRGVPFSIIISLTCHLLLTLWALFLIYDNFRWYNVAGAVGQVFRVMLLIWISTEIHSGNRIGRWISIVLGCLGFAWAYYIFEFLVPIVLESPLATQKPEIVSLMYFSVELQICLWTTNILALFMPSASQYCKD